MATNLSQDLEAVRSKLPDLLKTDMKTSDITSKSRSSRGGKPSTLIGDILQGESESTASELSAPKRTTTSTTNSNSTADRLLGGLEVGSKESAEEVDKAFRFTKEDQKAFEQKSDLRSSLVSQDLGYVTRADLEQLRKLKEAGSTREYEMLRSRLLEKKQHNEQIEQQNVATWGKIKTNIKTILKRRSDGLEKLEKQLVELNKLLGSSNTIGDRELKMARAIDDQYMDVMQFSFYNMMTAPERMLASLGPQLVDAFMNAFRIMDHMNNFDWTYLNPLSNIAELFYGKMFQGQVGNRALLGLDISHNPNNQQWGYRGPVTPFNLLSTTNTISDSYVMNGRGLYIMEPNMYEVAPVNNLMTLGEFQRQVQAQSNRIPSYNSFGGIILSLQNSPSTTAGTAPVGNMLTGLQDNIPTEVAQAWIMSLVPSQNTADANAVKGAIELITDGDVHKSMPNGYGGLPLQVPDCMLLSCLVNFHTIANTIDAEKKNRIMVELTKLNKSMAEMDSTIFKTLVDTSKQYVTNMMTKRTTLFHVAGVGSIIGSNMFYQMDVTLGGIGLERWLGMNVRHVQALQFAVSSNLVAVMPELISNAPNDERRFLIIYSYKRLLLMLKFMIVTCSKMYTIMNRHNEFNENSKLGNLYLTLKKLLWKVVFSDDHQFENNLSFLVNRSYLLSCGFRGWLKTQVLQLETGRNQTEFNNWFNFTNNPYISLETCQEYRSRLDALINSNNYRSFETFEISYTDGGTNKTTNPITLLNDIVKYIQTDMASVLADATADFLSEKVSLTNTNESDSIIF